MTLRRHKNLKAKNYAQGENWVTIKGTHVQLDGEGNITKGPSGLKKDKASKTEKKDAKTKSKGEGKPKKETSSKTKSDLNQMVGKGLYDVLTNTIFPLPKDAPSHMAGSAKIEKYILDNMTEEQIQDGIKATKEQNQAIKEKEAKRDVQKGMSKEKKEEIASKKQVYDIYKGMKKLNRKQKAEFKKLGKDPDVNPKAKGY